MRGDLSLDAQATLWLSSLLGGAAEGGKGIGRYERSLSPLSRVAHVPRVGKEEEVSKCAEKLLLPASISFFSCQPRAVGNWLIPPPFLFCCLWRGFRVSLHLSMASTPCTGPGCRQLAHLSPLPFLLLSEHLSPIPEKKHFINSPRDFTTH